GLRRKQRRPKNSPIRHWPKWQKVTTHMDHDHRVAVSSESGVPSTSLKERVRSLRLPQETSRRSRGGRGTIIFLCLICLGLAALAGFLGVEYYRATDRIAELNKLNPRPREDYTRMGESPSASYASGSSSVASSGEVVLERKGYIIPAHQILISPKVVGMIESL